MGEADVTDGAEPEIIEEGGTRFSLMYPETPSTSRNGTDGSKSSRERNLAGEADLGEGVGLGLGMRASAGQLRGQKSNPRLGRGQGTMMRFPEPPMRSVSVEGVGLANRLSMASSAETGQTK